MEEQTSGLLKENKASRWAALLMLSFTIMSAYFFLEMITPLKILLETHYNWETSSFDFFYNSKYFLILFGFLFLSGFVLDKYGIRISGLISILLMIIGAWIKLYALSPNFLDGGFVNSLTKLIFPSFPPSFVIASSGYALFGLGVEMTGITVSKAIFKWFRGYELAFAFGIQIAFARFGSTAAFFLTSRFADTREVFGLIHGNMMNPLYFGVSLLAIGFLTFLTFSLMDSKLDYQIKEKSKLSLQNKIKLKDLYKVFTNKSLLLIALIWAFTYSGFQIFSKYFINLIKSENNLSDAYSNLIFGLLLAGTIIAIPLIGSYIDKNGKTTQIIIIGSVSLTLSYLLLALIPPSSIIFIFSGALIFASFTLIPAASLPLVPKIVEEKILGISFSVFFWLQSIFLMLIPLICGIILDYFNENITNTVVDNNMLAEYNYTFPLLFLVLTGIANIFISVFLNRKYKNLK